MIGSHGLIMERFDIIRSLAPLVGKGLEIGPSHSPLAAKKDGYDVEILDYLDADALRAKYAAAGADVSRIEAVDYVADGRPLADVIGAEGRYDWIIASHVIEHVPDLVLFLRECRKLLRPGGALVLAVPDKRCCFDIFRPISTVGQVLQAHLDCRTRPVPGILFDDVAYARQRGGNIGWHLKDDGALEAVRPLSFAAEVFRQACGSSDYVDMHCWVFVPSSFRLIVSTLASLGQISLREAVFRHGHGEFFAVLTEDGTNCGETFSALAEQAMLEEREATLGSPGASHSAQDQDQEALLARLRNAEVALAEADATIKSLTGSLRALESATFWRATAPMRALVERIRR